MIFAMQFAIGEPPFAHIKHALGLDGFALGGKRNVNIKWILFCMVHNLKRFTVVEPALPDNRLKARK